MNNKHFSANVVLCGMAYWLAGCAALTIDVDVYKGPLVNDTHVQTESMTVMAMGAKPLLIQLRNTMEEKAIERANIQTADHWDYPEGLYEPNYPFLEKRGCLNGTKKIVAFQGHKNYGQGFIEEDYEFCGHDSFKVNAILSLYEDQKYNPISMPVQEIKHAIRDYNLFSDILFPKDLKHQKDLWKNLKTAFKIELQTERQKANSSLESKKSCAGNKKKGNNPADLGPTQLQGEESGEAPIECAKTPFSLETKNSGEGNEVPGESTEISKATNKSKLNSPEPYTINDLVDAYRNFLAPQKENRSIKEIFIVHDHLQKTNLSQGEILGEQYSSWPKVEDLLDSGDFNGGCKDLFNESYDQAKKELQKNKKGCGASYTSMFLALAENKKNIVDIHANALFPLESDQKRQFIATVIQIGQSFLKVRKATRQIFHALLDINHLLDFPGEEIEKLKRKHGDEIPEMIMGLSVGHYLVSALKNMNEAGTLLPNIAISDETPRDNLEDKITIPKSKIISWYGNEDLEGDSKQNSKRIRGQFLEQLKTNRIEMTDLLRKADLYLALLTDEYELRSTFGITVGPMNPEESNLEKIIDGIIEGVGTAVSNIKIAAGLGKGRLDDGLETLIERYLKVADQQPPDFRVIKAERDRLFDGLIRFSQTVLFLANHRILLDSEPDTWFSRLTPLGNLELQKKKIHKDTKILQAVGNSILNQIDEISHKERYEEELDKRGPREALAMKVAFPRYATEAVDQLIQRFGGEAKISEDQLVKADTTFNQLVEAADGAENKLKGISKELGEKTKAFNKANKAFKTLHDHSGFLFQTNGGYTKGGTIKGPGDTKNGKYSGSILANVSALTSLNITGGDYEGGSNQNSSKPGEGYGGKLSDLIIQGGQTNGGELIGGNLTWKISTESHQSLPAKSTVTGENVTVKYPSFTGTISSAKATYSLKATTGKKLTITIEKGSTPKINETIVGKFNEGTIQGTITSCTKIAVDSPFCKIDGEKIDAVELSNLSLDDAKLNQGELIPKKTISLVRSSLEQTMNTSKIFKKDDQMILEGTLSQNSEKIVFGTESALYGEIQEVQWKSSKDANPPEITGGTLAKLSGPVIFTWAEGSSPTIEIDLEKNPVMIASSNNNLTLTNASITNAWILDGTTTQDEKQILPQKALVSGATLKGEKKKPISLSQWQIKDLRWKNDNLTGVIVTATLGKDSTSASGGTATGGTLKSAEKKSHRIGRASRLNAGPIKEATVNNATVTLKDEASYTLVNGVQLVSGTVISSTLKGGTLSPQPTDKEPTVEKVNVLTASFKEVTLKDAVLKGSDEEVLRAKKITIKATNGSSIVTLNLKNATVINLEDGKVSGGKSVVSTGEIDGRFAFPDKTQAIIDEGTLEKTTIEGVSLDNGSFTGAETVGGETQYIGELAEMIANTARITKKAFFDKLEMQLDQKIGTSTCPSDPVLRSDQLACLKKVLSSVKERQFPAEQIKGLENPAYIEIDKNKADQPSFHTVILAHLILSQLWEQQHQANLEMDKIQREVTEKQKENDSQKAKRDAADKAKTKYLEKYQAKFKTAQATLLRYQDDILHALAREGRLDSSDLVYRTIGDVLEQKKAMVSAQGTAGSSGNAQQKTKNKTNESSGDPSTDLSSTIATLQQTPEPLRVPSPQETQGLDAKEVMDQLIATLKYEHIAAVREGGEQSTIAQQIEKSLKTAYTHRASMVLIRPALAFLRSSYPSPALQEEAPLEWKNMLTENAFRSIPFTSNFVTGKSLYADSTLRVQSQIDKLFWHNVNRIKLNGAGDTNYVLIKDDIGNWTVKNYSANPRDIINSATNLAMFGFGGSATNFLDRSQPGAPQPGGDTGNQSGQVIPNTADQNPSLLERQFNRFDKLYQEQTDKDLEAAESLTNSLGGNIKAAWQKEPLMKEAITSLSSIVDTAQEKHLDNLEPSRHNTEEKAQEMLNRLRAVKSFHREIELGILEKQQDLGAETTQKALTLLTGEVQKRLLAFIKQRQETVKTFEVQISVLNDSVTK